MSVGFFAKCFECKSMSGRIYDGQIANKWVLEHFEETGHVVYGKHLDKGLNTLIVRIDSKTKEIHAGCCGSTLMHEDKEDLKAQLPEEDLKESLGNIKSDMVKRLDSEPLQRKVKDEREDSDVL